MSASIITSSPYKTMLEDKAKKPKTVEKKAGRKSATAKQAKSLKAPHATLNCAPHREFKCPSCEEIFTDPPTEDWIECAECNEWWHEGCTNYRKKGRFVCDTCRP